MSSNKKRLSEIAINLGKFSEIKWENECSCEAEGDGGWILAGGEIKGFTGLFIFTL